MNYPKELPIEVRGKVYSLLISKVGEGQLRGHVFGLPSVGVVAPGKLFFNIPGEGDAEVEKKARELLEEKFRNEER